MGGTTTTNIRHLDLGQSDPAVDVGCWSAKLRLRPERGRTAPAAIPGADGRGRRAADPAIMGRRREFGERRRRQNGATAGYLGALSGRRRKCARRGSSRASTNLQPVHVAVHSGRDQRDSAWNAAGERAVAEPAGERGEFRQRFRRLEARDPARGRTGSRRPEHRPDAGESEQPEFHSSAGGGDGRHRQHADGPAGQPVGGAVAGRACQPGGGRA